MSAESHPDCLFREWNGQLPAAWLHCTLLASGSNVNRSEIGTLPHDCMTRMYGSSALCRFSLLTALPIVTGACRRRVTHPGNGTKSVAR